MASNQSSRSEGGTPTGVPQQRRIHARRQTRPAAPLPLDLRTPSGRRLPW